MKQNSNGIYTYIGEVNQNGAFHGQGTLTYPSGKPVRATFTNNQLQIKADLANEDNKLGIVIDCTLLTQEQFNKHIESLLQAMELNDGDTIAITHHQLQLTNKTANNIANQLKKKGIKILQWISCSDGDNNIEKHIKNFKDQDIKVVAVPYGQSAVTVKHGNAEYFVGIDNDRNLNKPTPHSSVLGKRTWPEYEKSQEGSDNINTEQLAPLLLQLIPGSPSASASLKNQQLQDPPNQSILGSPSSLGLSPRSPSPSLQLAPVFLQLIPGSPSASPSLKNQQLQDPPNQSILGSPSYLALSPRSPSPSLHNQQQVLNYSDEHEMNSESAEEESAESADSLAEMEPTESDVTFSETDPGESADTLSEMELKELADPFAEMEPKESAVTLAKMEPKELADPFAEMDPNELADILADMEPGELANDLAKMAHKNAAAILAKMDDDYDVANIIVLIAVDDLKHGANILADMCLLREDFAESMINYMDTDVDKAIRENNGFSREFSMRTTIMKEILF